MKLRLSRILPSVGVLAMLAAAPAQAQDEEEIVVTGTSIRGVAPAGAQVLGLGEEEIESTGATTTAQLLANIPQIGVFNTTPVVLGANNYRQSTNRPNVRSLPVGGIAGGSPTLLLMDGHRIVGSGVIQTTPDSDVLPPGIIQRVEVVTDGGSAVYGADAVGGVVNYITRRSFEGVQVDSRLGFASDYSSTDVSLTAGHDWGTGNVFVSYNYLTHDAIYGRDREYVRDVDWSTPDLTPRGRTCDPGNVTKGVVTSGIGPSGPLATPNVCDVTDDVALYPQERKDSVFASFTQDLSDSITFDLDAYYSDRVDKNDGGALGTTVTINSSNPYFQPAYGAGSQSVAFNFASATGNSTIARGITETWGFIPSLTFDLGHDWQLRALLNYGHSQTATINPQINTTALGLAAAATTVDTALNPYDPAATHLGVLLGDPSKGLGGILNSVLYGRGENELANAKAVFDGPLFTLPGGQVSLAVGAEYTRETYNVRTGSVAIGDQASLELNGGSRHADSAFAELNIPIVGEDNNVPLVSSLSLNLSERYDDYSDFGSTSNPRVGFTYEPLDWITFRGTWGKSFQAPSLANTAGAQPTIVALLNTQVGGEAPGAPFPANYYKLFYSGSDPHLRPQTSTAYSFGFDIQPPIVENLDLSLTYYNIEYRDKIALPPIFLNSFYTDFPNGYLLNPANHSQALTDYLAVGSNGADIQALLDANPGTVVYTAYNSLQSNLGSTKVDGLDASARYSRDVGFGSIYASASASYRLGIHDSASPNDPYGPNYAGGSQDGPRTSATAMIGAVIHDNFRAQASLNYSGPVTYSPSATGQTRVESFKTLNLFFQYDFQGEGVSNDLSVSLGIDNALDEEPSLYTGDADPNRHGWANGATLGRLVQVGLNKRF